MPGLIRNAICLFKLQLIACKYEKKFLFRIVPRFKSLLVKKKKGVLRFCSLRNFQTRNESVIKLIEEANRKYKINNFDTIVINTDDLYEGEEYKNIRIYNFSGPRNSKNLCPDFLYQAWPETGLNDYEKTRIAMVDKVLNLHKSKIIWRGAVTNLSRENLLSLSNDQEFDFKVVDWNALDENGLPKNYMTFEEIVTESRYLIDVEGRGYSSRLKLLLSSCRVVFIQERELNEWYFKYLTPWVHFVPVKNDLSDLKEAYEIISNDILLEQNIIAEAKKISDKYLSRDSAISEYGRLLESLNGI